jgi:hypothetical protein
MPTVPSRIKREAGNHFLSHVLRAAPYNSAKAGDSLKFIWLILFTTFQNSTLN